MTGLRHNLSSLQGENKMPGDMSSLVMESFSSINAPYTIFLSLMVLYWAIQAFGLASLDFLDLDFDADSSDQSALSSLNAKWITGYFCLGRVPFTISLTIVAVSLWLFGVLGNHLLNPDKRWDIALLLLIPNVFLCGLTIRLTLFPVVKLWKFVEQGDQSQEVNMIGKVASLHTSEIRHDFGQAIIENPDGAPFIIDARSAYPGQIFKKGQRVAVVKELEGSPGIYLVKLN